MAPSESIKLGGDKSPSFRRNSLGSVALLAVLCCTSAAQNISAAQKSNAANEQASTFCSGVNLVLVPVVVRNKQGQAVGNLTRQDFQIFDEGKRQAIASFSAVKRTANTRASNSAVNPAPGAQRQPETAAPAHANPPPQRFIVYLFDDFNTDFTRMATARSALARQLRTLANTDRAAIYTFSDRPQIDFTGSRKELEETAAKLRSRFGPNSIGLQGCPNIDYYLADLIRNRGDGRAHKAAVAHTVQCAHVDPFAATAIVTGAVQRELLLAPHQSTTALRALRLAIRRLAHMPGDRLIILVSPGFFSQSHEALSDTQDVLRMAAKAHVVISSLNPHGLYVAEPEASESQEANLAWWDYRRQSIQANESIMKDLAQGSGGIYVRNTDLRTGFDHLAALPEF